MTRKSTQNKDCWTFYLMSFLWCSLIIAGWLQLVNYSLEPGELKDTPPHWPINSAINVNESKMCLMFVHPNCPCTAASINELNRILTTCETKSKFIVVFSIPKSMTENWDKSMLWEQVNDLDIVSIHVDQNQIETNLFNVETSGTVLLYGVDRKLLFAGGITPSRGHEGDNSGKSALLGKLNGSSRHTELSIVFGCKLASDTDLSTARSTCEKERCHNCNEDNS